MEEETIKHAFFKIKALTVRECMDKGIRRIYDPNWLEKNCYIKLGKKTARGYPPWFELYSEETQAFLKIEIPQVALIASLQGGLDSICLEYHGPISTFDKEDD